MAARLQQTERPRAVDPVVDDMTKAIRATLTG
jgi:hypothetical protein